MATNPFVLFALNRSPGARSVPVSFVAQLMGQLFFFPCVAQLGRTLLIKAGLSRTDLSTA